MHRPFLIAGTVAGGLAVAFGAFGAHALESITNDEKILHAFQTGVNYQFYHAFALLAVGILDRFIPGRWLRWSGRLFILGIILFAGSLYLLSFLKIQDSAMVRYIGPLTPIGGLLLLFGWLLLLVAVLSPQRMER